MPTLRRVLHSLPATECCADCIASSVDAAAGPSKQARAGRQPLGRVSGRPPPGSSQAQLNISAIFHALTGARAITGTG